MDAGTGNILVSTGEKPRVLFQASCYNGTNSAAAQIGLTVVPATAGLPIVAGQKAMLGNIGFVLGTVDADLSGAAELQPLQFGPFATKGAGVGTPIATIPPNSELFITAIGATNGTIVANCISAEMD